MSGCHGNDGGAAAGLRTISERDGCAVSVRRAVSAAARKRRSHLRIRRICAARRHTVPRCQASKGPARGVARSKKYGVVTRPTAERDAVTGSGMGKTP